MQTRSISKGRGIPSHLKSIRPNSLEGRDERINKVRSVTKSVGSKLKKTHWNIDLLTFLIEGSDITAVQISSYHAYEIE